MSIPAPNPNPEQGPAIFGPLSGAEALHHRIMGVFQHGETTGHQDFDLKVDPDNGEAERFLYLTGPFGENPIVLMTPEGQIKYLDAGIHVVDQFDDVPALGLDADGQASAIMQMDHMAELSERIIDIVYTLHDQPERPLPNEASAGWRNLWRIRYRAGHGWSGSFWKGEDLGDIVLEDHPWKSPTEEDRGLLRTVLEHTDRIL